MLRHLYHEISIEHRIDFGRLCKLRHVMLVYACAKLSCSNVYTIFAKQYDQLKCRSINRDVWYLYLHQAIQRVHIVTANLWLLLVTTISTDNRWLLLVTTISTDNRWLLLVTTFSTDNRWLLLVTTFLLRRLCQFCEYFVFLKTKWRHVITVILFKG